jgi:signal transduction histidine kinase/CheY-like chemotaxis protein
MPDFRVLFESLPGSFLVVDRRFGIVAASDAYLEMTRTRLAEIQGKCLCDAFPTPDGSDDFARKELLRESLERVRNLGVPDAMPFQKFWVRESKAEGGGWVERFWSPVSSPVFGPDKRVEFLIHRLDDVTDFVLAGGGRNTASPVTDARVRLERVEADAFQKARQLAEANRKLEKANAEIVRLKLENGELDRQKADFLSRISHEFRSPLTLLAGSLDGLLEPAEDPSRQLSKPQVELAQRGAGRILRMVDSLLDFSLLESGTRTPVYRAEDLSEATLRICDRFRPLALQGGLDLDALCEPLREPVFFDRGMWAEIVSRLLTNALKFTREGSIRVLFRIVGRHAVLRISDTGAGIPEADLPFLFGRFYRGRSPEARTHEGLGMGLAIVREMVRIHGGEIRAESRLGTGSTFTVKVPLGSAHLRKRPTTEGSGAEEEERTVTAALAEAGRWFPAPEAPLPDSSAHRESGPSAIRDGVPRRHRILFADDDVDMRVHVQRVLETRWTVETAADGEEALKRALADPPDLILADALMPALDGMGLARALREDPRTRNLPVLLILARPGERTSLGGLGAAADDCIVKPYAPRDLILWVDGHLRLADIRKRFDAESTAAWPMTSTTCSPPSMDMRISPWNSRRTMECAIA